MIDALTKARARAWYQRQIGLVRYAVQTDPIEAPVPQGEPLDLALPIIRAEERLHDLRADGLVYPYHDPVGFPTQGYGRLLARDKWGNLSQYPAIDTETAERWLHEDASKALQAVRRLVPVPMTVEQLAALTSFTFNVGPGNLQISTLRKKILRGDLEGAADEFPKWRLAGGVELAGLVARRLRERELFMR